MNTAHIEQFLSFENQTRKLSQLSATKLKLTLQLQGHGLLEIGEEEYVYLTDKGKQMITFLEELFNTTTTS